MPRTSKRPGLTLQEAKKEAQARGDKTFEVSWKCKYGHEGPRYSSTGTCVKCEEAKREVRKYETSPTPRTSNPERLLRQHELRQSVTNALEDARARWQRFDPSD